MTLDGTNTWLIAEPGSPLVRGGGPRAATTRATCAGCTPGRRGGRRVAKILLTHGHPDHSAGAARFAELTGAPVRAADPAHRLRRRRARATATWSTAAGCELRVVATPGHTADSVCLLLPADGALLTGDTVLGRGTTVIAGRRRASATTCASWPGCATWPATGTVGLLLPGHGPTAGRPGRRRSTTTSRTGGAAGPGPGGAGRGGADAAPRSWRMVYADVDRSLWPAAERSVRAQLDYLADAEP